MRRRLCARYAEQQPLLLLLTLLLFSSTAVAQVPIFTPGRDVLVTEDSGQYGSSWATEIVDRGSPARSLTFTTTAANPGLFKQQPAINSAGMLTFIPADDANGATLVTVSLRACGGQTCENSASRTFTITVMAVNDCPTFLNNGDVEYNEDAGTVTVQNWANTIDRGASDESNQRLTWTVTNDNPSLFFTEPFIVWGAGGTGGSTASLRFEAAPHHHGKAKVTVVVKDDGGKSAGGCDTSGRADMTITIKPINDAPFFTFGVNPIRVQEDSGKHTFSRWATGISPGNDQESDQTVRFTLQFVNPAQEAMFQEQPEIDEAGTLTFKLNTDYNTFAGSVKIRVQLKDDDPTNPLSSCTLASCPELEIIINPVNDIPTFTKGPDITVYEDRLDTSPPPSPATYRHAQWATDISPGNTLESTVEGQSVTFTVTPLDETMFSVQPTIDAQGTLSFTLEPHKNGVTTIYVDIRDNHVTDPMTGTRESFVLTVSSVNDGPTFEIVEASPLNIPQSAGFQDIQTFLKAVKAGPTGATDEIQSQTTSLEVSTVPQGMFEIPPYLTMSGNEIARLRFKVKDGESGEARLTIGIRDTGGVDRGGVDLTQQAFVIQVNSVNTPPTFGLAGGLVSVLEDSANSGYSVTNWAINILPGTGADGIAEQATQSVNFQLTVDNPTLFSTPPAMDSTGTLTFTTVPNTFGQALVTVRATDTSVPPANALETKSFTLSVIPVNDAPSFTAGADITAAECTASAGTDCFHSYPAWATNIHRGTPGSDAEASQTLTFTLVPSTTTSGSGDGTTLATQLFSEAPSVSPDTGLLTFSLRRGGGNTAAIGSIVFAAILRDSGTETNGGVSSVTRTFRITVSAYVPPPSFTFASSLPTNVYEDSTVRQLPGWITSISPGKPLVPGTSASSVMQFSVVASDSTKFTELPTINWDSQTEASLLFVLAPHAHGDVQLTVTLQHSETTMQEVQKTTLRIVAVNDAPSFTLLQTEITVSQGSGSYTSRIASEIAAGPQEAAGQVLTFGVTCQTVQAIGGTTIFTADPVIDREGLLSFVVDASVFGSTFCTIVLRDSGGTAQSGIDTSAPQYLTITVLSLNRKPAFIKGGDVTVFEDAAPVVLSQWATGITDGEPSMDGANRQGLTFEVTCEASVQTRVHFPTIFDVPPAIAASGDLSFVVKPNANGVATCQVKLRDDGEAAPPHSSVSDTQTFTLTVVSVNDAPSYTPAPSQLTIVLYQNDPLTTLTNWASNVVSGPTTDETSSQQLIFTTTASDPSLFAFIPTVSTSSGTMLIQPAADKAGSSTLEVCLKDNGGINTDAASAEGRGVDTYCITVAVTVIRVNSDPVVGLTSTAIDVLEDEGRTGVNAQVEIPNFVTRLFGGTNAAEQTQTIVTVTADCLCSEQGVKNTSQLTALFLSAPQAILNSTTSPQSAGIRFGLRPDANGQCPRCVVTATDSNGGTATAEFAINVVAVNDPPSFSISALGSGAGSPTVGNVVSTSTVSVDVFEDSTNASFTNWAVDIAAGPTQDERSSQTVAFDLLPQRSIALNSYFSRLPIVDHTTGTLSFGLRPESFPARQSPFVFSVVLRDNGGTSFGGSDFTDMATLGGSRQSKVLLSINVVPIDRPPTFSALAPDVLLLEDAVLTVRPAWATSIEGGVSMNTDGSASAVPVSQLTFQVTTDRPELFAELPTVSPTSGDLIIRPAANQHGSANVTAALARSTNGKVSQSAVKTFVVTVQGINDPPSATLLNGVVTVDEDANFILADHIVTTGNDSTPVFPPSLRPMQILSQVSPGPFEAPMQIVTAEVSCDEEGSRLFGAALSGFAVDGHTGYVSRLVPRPGLSGTTRCTIVLKDDGGVANGGVDVSASIEIEVRVLPVNDPPTISLATDVLEIVSADGAATEYLVSRAAATGISVTSFPMNGGAPYTIRILRFISNLTVGGAEETLTQTLNVSTRCGVLPNGQHMIDQTAGVSTTMTTNGDATIEMVLVPNRLGAVNCEVTATDSGTGPTNAVVRPFTLVVAPSNLRPTSILEAQFITAAVGQVVSKPMFLTNITAGGDVGDSVTEVALEGIVTISGSAAPTAVFSGLPQFILSGTTASMSFTASTVVGNVNVTYRIVDARGGRAIGWFAVVVTDASGQAALPPPAPSGVRLGKMIISGGTTPFNVVEFQTRVARTATLISPVTVLPRDVIVVSTGPGNEISFYLNITGLTGNPQKATTEETILSRLVSGVQTNSSDPLVSSLRGQLGVVSATTDVATQAPASEDTQPAKGSSQPFSTGLIVAIVIAALLVLILIIVLVVVCVRRSKKSDKDKEKEKGSTPPKQSPEKSTGGRQMKYQGFDVVPYGDEDEGMKSDRPRNSRYQVAGHRGPRTNTRERYPQPRGVPPTASGNHSGLSGWGSDYDPYGEPAQRSAGRYQPDHYYTNSADRRRYGRGSYSIDDRYDAYDNYPNGGSDYGPGYYDRNPMHRFRDPNYQSPYRMRPEEIDNSDITPADSPNDSPFTDSMPPPRVPPHVALPVRGSTPRRPRPRLGEDIPPHVADARESYGVRTPSPPRNEPRR